MEALLKQLQSKGMVDVPGTRMELYMCQSPECKADPTWRKVHVGHYGSWAQLAESGVAARSSRGVLYCPVCAPHYTPNDLTGKD